MTFDLTKGITLICPSGPCTVASGNGTAFGFPTGSSTKFYRISGFTFTAAGGLVWTCPAGGCTGTLTSFRFDHNTCSGISAGATVITIGENTAKQYVYGVIDHNTFSAASSFVMMQVFGATDPSAPASQQGTGNNLFMEDNTMSVTTMTDTGSGAMDGWGSMAAVVFRNNTVTNSLPTIHSAETVGGHANGAANWEVYGNHVTMNSGADPAVQNGFRSIHHQGSHEELFYNNLFTPLTEPIDIDALSLAANYPPQYTGAYPTIYQPGRDYKSQILYPVYTWNNRDTNNSNKVTANDGSGFPTYFAPNRDYYDETGKGPQTTSSSPFNGSSGVGFGTLANRPTSCTPTPSVLAPDQGRGGVGYFATDVGPQGSNGGTLFACTSTNTWSPWWAEYQYPHPLQGFSVYPTMSPGAGSYSGSQTVTVTNPNASGVVCYTTNGTTPATNGDGTTCATGTAFTASTSNITVSTTQTVKAIAGTSTVSDSQVNQQPFTISGGAAPATAPGGMLADLMEVK
jgi:chitobiase/beta-hexosaminidase-like protein